MARIHIDRLLNTVVVRGASELHLRPGRPAEIRLDGELYGLKTGVLEPDDTVGVMESVSPGPNREELLKAGITRFDLQFGKAAVFKVTAYRDDDKSIMMAFRAAPRD